MRPLASLGVTLGECNTTLSVIPKSETTRNLVAREDRSGVRMDSLQRAMKPLASLGVTAGERNTTQSVIPKSEMTRNHVAREARSGVRMDGLQQAVRPLASLGVTAQVCSSKENHSYCI